MAFTANQNISGEVTKELIASGEGISSIKSILIANTHATNDTFVDLYIDLYSRTYYLMKGYLLRKGETLILNEREGWSTHIKFDNSVGNYSLNLKLTGVGTTSPTADVMIKK
jgi:hypothetical protein